MPRQNIGFKLLGKRSPQKQGKFSSNKTRFASLHGFMGGAEINEKHCSPKPMPHDSSENLEARFNSGANRTDLPSAWGPADVVRTIGPIHLSLMDEIKGWFRKGGEIIYQKGQK